MRIRNSAGQPPGSRPSIHVDEANARLKYWHPQAIVEWALGEAKKPILSTNFRPLAAGLLHMVTRADPETPVVWVDTGYNTTATYEFAERLLSDLKLDLRVFTPRMTVARRRAIANGIPDIGDPAHAAFAREVKLEPFERALDELEPDVWLTGIRREQTEFRRTLDIVTFGPRGTVRVAPMFHWTDIDLEGYVYDHKLPDNEDYFDPTKIGDDRECGLQTLS